jgi:hypothetical protein
VLRLSKSTLCGCVFARRIRRLCVCLQMYSVVPLCACPQMFTSVRLPTDVQGEDLRRNCPGHRSCCGRDAIPVWNSSLASYHVLMRHLLRPISPALYGSDSRRYAYSGKSGSLGLASSFCRPPVSLSLPLVLSFSRLPEPHACVCSFPTCIKCTLAKYACAPMRSLARARRPRASARFLSLCSIRTNTRTHMHIARHARVLSVWLPPSLPPSLLPSLPFHTHHPPSLSALPPTLNFKS